MDIPTLAAIAAAVCAVVLTLPVARILWREEQMVRLLILATVIRVSGAKPKDLAMLAKGRDPP